MLNFGCWIINDQSKILNYCKFISTSSMTMVVELVEMNYILKKSVAVCNGFFFVKTLGQTVGADRNNLIQNPSNQHINFINLSTNKKNQKISFSLYAKS